MFKEQLQAFVLANPTLVTQKQSVAYPALSVLKYKHKVFYDALWNEYLEECRGTVIDPEFNVVSRPFTKIYNWGIEARAPQLALDTAVTAYRKVNGFMVAVSSYNNDVLVSTTGSLDSDFVAMAKEIMLTHQSWDLWQKAVTDHADTTFMFECVHPNDPHIVVEQAGMYLLGTRRNTWDSVVHGYGDDVATEWQRLARDCFNCFTTDAIHTTVGELVELSQGVTHEGFVAYTNDGVSFKIKSPHYLFNKFIARKSSNKLLDILQNKTYMQLVDEEYYPLCDYLRADMQTVVAMSEQDRLAYIREYIFKNTFL